MTQLQKSERTWEVDDQFSLPRLDDIAGRVNHSSVEVTSTYYDTPDRSLHSHGARLRRRQTGDDVTWQLDLPSGERIDVRTDADTPPAGLTGMLEGLLLGRRPESVATIRTHRERYQITDADRLLAELDDDRVRASVDDRVLTWREIDLRSAEGHRDLVPWLARRLRKAGAHRTRFGSKLARAYHTTGPDRSTPPARRQALRTYLVDQIDEIFAGDVSLRRDQDPIHDTRVAIRRLRSTLRVFSTLLDETTVAATESELRWFAGLLGEVRDCAVQRERFTAAVAQLPPDLVLGPVAHRIQAELLAEQVSARARVDEAMTSERYFSLLGTLSRWRTEPPIVGRPDRRTLDTLSRRAGRTARRRLRAALRSDDDALMHRARKAVKRARYAAELASPAGTSASTTRTIKRYKTVQRILGDHQDSVVAAERLRQFAVTAGTAGGENGFTFGVLYARERQIAEDARRQAHRQLS
jgi:CHAD domain-containing protein